MTDDGRRVAADGWDAWPRAQWWAVAAAGCFVAALAATWPLVWHLTSAVPLGTETAPTIPVFDIWTLWWSGTRLWHAYAGLWNAPTFHPTAGAFAFSEPMLLPGALVAPLFAFGAPPALAHNVAMLAILTANGLAGCRLVRAFGVTRPAALLTGALVVTLPIFAKLQGELPVLGVAGALAALDGVVRFGRSGRTREALQVTGGLVVQALCCQQLTAFSVLFVGAAVWVALRERRFSRGAILRLGSALLLAAVLVYAVAYVPLVVHRRLGFHRSDEVVQSLSATPLDFLSRPRNALVGVPPRETADTFTGGLFPGLAILILAVVGFFDRRRGGTRSPATRWRWYALGGVVTGVALALGLNLSLGAFRPFALLRTLPGFGEIRSPFRAAVFAQLHLVILAAGGFDVVARQLGRRRSSLLLLIGLLAIAENASVPAPLLAIPRTPRTGWTAFVAAQPPETVAVHVPFPTGGEVEDFSGEAWRLFAQMDHRHPLVNGYASNFPAEYREFMFAMGASFPKPILACALRTIFGADLLIVDQPWLAAHRQGFQELSALLTAAYADSEVAAFRVTPPPDACPPMRLDIGR